MIQRGQSITNHVTGETLVFRTTSADTNGESVVVEAFVTPDGAVAAAHVHPSQQESFEIVAGELEFRVGRKKLVARPGDRVVVPAGTPHRFRNVGGQTAHFVCEVTPALGFEQLIETMFSLAGDGKVNRKGMPNPLRLAVIANHHFGDVRLPFPPAWLQRLGLLARGSDRTAARLPADVRGRGTEGPDRVRHLTTTRPGRKTSDDHHHLDAAAIGSERSRPARLAPLAGLGLIGGLIALFASPEEVRQGETPREVVAYAASHESWILAMAFFGLAVIPLGGVFVAALHARLRGIATATESTLVLIGGIAFTLSFSLALTIWSAPLTDIAGARELAVADAYLAIDDIGWFLFGASGVGVAMMAIPPRSRPAQPSRPAWLAGSASRWASRRSPRSRSSASSPGWRGSQARRS